MDLCELLGTELRRRRERNPRYSLRAFARRLGTHHSTLSALIQRRRRLTPLAARRLGARLGLTPRQITEACLAENGRQILRLLDDPRFRADARWIAMMTGIPLDDVEAALHHLIWSRQLTMRSATRWTGACPR
jgi:hypothetical protein